MKWTKWENTVWGDKRTVRGDISTAEVSLTLNAIANGWEVDLWVFFPTGDIDAVQVRRRDLCCSWDCQEAQEQAIAWADGVIEKLGAFLSTEGSDVITGRESQPGSGTDARDS